MKVHFIYADAGTYYYPGAHHGLASIFSMLRSHGHFVSLQHVKKAPSRREILEKIHREQPDLIAFSATTNQIRYVELWSMWIKQEFTIPTICGGVHATLHPEEVIQFGGIDMICRGEGEYPMLELADRMGDTSHIKNLWVKKDGTIHKNDLRPLIPRLDDLVLPDYDLFDCNRILKDRKGDFAVLASRGCPFSCTYCCNHALRKVYGDRNPIVRFRSVDNVLEELKLLTSKYPIRRFSFADDVFAISKEWALEFCEKYPENFDLEFTCNARVDMIDEETLKNLRRANCTEIGFGVEAGNEWLRREILNRKMSNEQIINAFNAAHKVGIKTISSNMIGLPYETAEMIEETINLNKQLAPDHIIIFFFYPYPGTELYKICEKEGLLSGMHSASYISESVLDLDTITRKELEKLYARFYRYAIKREIKSFHSLVRYPVMVIDRVIGGLLGKRSIQMLMKIYLKFFRMFSLLRGNK